MTEENENQDAYSSKTSITLNSSSSKSDVEVRREKKKKIAAFQTFLEVKPEPPPLGDLPRRNLSSSQAGEQHRQCGNSCPICGEYLTHQARLCEFCKETVCAGHFRKRRRNSCTNKWTRICECCEDRWLIDRHYQNEMKTAESLLTQEIILTNRHKELAGLVEAKQAKLLLLLNKKASIAQKHAREMAKLAAVNAELDKRCKVLEGSLRQNGNMEFSLMSQQSKLPPSLQADYQFLQSENLRMTKDLVKYEKLCNDAVKSRSQREKEMYREYYQWEQQKRREAEAAQKEEECRIY